ncbi:MAG: hypothetical protein KGH57_03725 [Candidatus Micrarchaeota archaeon]|nr:hypothetical protein [Candidatus Micrarchaeota archaeon]
MAAKKPKFNVGRFSREVIILTLFTEVVWMVFWSPFGLILSYNLTQWEEYFIFSIPYDLALAYVTSKVIILFDRWARKRRIY